MARRADFVEMTYHSTFFDEAIAIEELCFEPDFQWNRDHFRQTLNDHHTFGIAVRGSIGPMAGFMIYHEDLRSSFIEIFNIAVHPKFHRCGVGRSMLVYLFDRLRPGFRDTIFAKVREGNLSAQLFLKSMGFGVIDVYHGLYDETDEDVYQFAFSMRANTGVIGCQNSQIGKS